MSAGDALIMRGEPRAVRLAFGLRRPKRPTIGRDVAGVVEAVGPAVTRFRVGDPVYAESDQGGYAELVAVAEGFVARRPANLDVIHAAAVPVSATTALQGWRLADVGPGRHVLVNGASGGVGGFAVQLAKAMGAEVTGVCRGAKADHVRAIGADHVVDYTRDDFTDGDGQVRRGVRPRRRPFARPHPSRPHAARHARALVGHAAERCSARSVASSVPRS